MPARRFGGLLTALGVSWSLVAGGRFACGALLLVGVPVGLAFPCFLIGLLGSPLCGAAPTFFAAAKKVGKESGLATASP